MLLSKKLELERSKVRQQLGELAAKDAPTEEETRSMQTLDTQYGQLEQRFRAALISEDSERRAANEDFANNETREYSKLVDRFELRQIAACLDNGEQLSGETLEVVTELRSRGNYAGLPVPLEALEIRSGETVAGGVFDPKQTRPVIERLFPASVAAQMGIELITIDHGAVEWPVSTGGATAAWAGSELGDVGGPQVYTTVDKPLVPNHNLGTQMILSRRTLKQAGAALEMSVRKDMNATISAALDRAIFLGAGASGVPLGAIPGATSYGFTEVAVGADASYQVFRNAATQFLIRNAGDYKSIKLLIRTELLDMLDDEIYETSGLTSELDRIISKLGAVIPTANALAEPVADASTAVMMCSANGTPAMYCGVWGGVDLVRDNFTKAASGQLILTAILTADCTASRSAQTTILTGLGHGA